MQIGNAGIAGTSQLQGFVSSGYHRVVLHDGHFGLAHSSRLVTAALSLEFVPSPSPYMVIPALFNFPPALQGCAG